MLSNPAFAQRRWLCIGTQAVRFFLSRAGLIEDGTASGGMIPKLQNAMQAVCAQNAHRVLECEFDTFLAETVVVVWRKGFFLECVLNAKVDACADSMCIAERALLQASVFAMLEAAVR
eukprot:6193786-Pleurochrysis_carterae.AAC.4